MKKLVLIALFCIILSGCVGNVSKIKPARLDTSVGEFIIEGKVAKQGTGGAFWSYPEYSITVKKGEKEINFYADHGYFPRMGNRHKGWSDEELLVGIFINFLTGAHKTAILNYDEFDKNYSQVWGKINDIENELNRNTHQPETNLHETSKKLYDEYRSNLDKLKILLGNASDFSSKFDTLYKDSLKLREKMELFLGSFLESDYAKDAEGFLALGITNTKQGNLNQAILDYNQAIEMNPNYVEAYYNRGVAWFKEGLYEQAWQDIHKAESLGYKDFDPKFIESLKKASGREK